MERTRAAQKVAWVIAFAVAIVLLVAGLFWRETATFVQTYDPFFKLVGLVVGPLLAILGFTWGLLDKAELKDNAEELGRTRQLAESERARAEEAREQISSQVRRIETLEHDLRTIADTGRLWKLRKNAAFPEYRAWKFDPEGAKIVTISLFKGGVGKTHLAANFAAYVSERQQRPVLLIDLDYQGSLSTLMLRAAGIEPTGSKVDALLTETADLATLSENRDHLANHGPEVVLNNGRGLSRAWLVPSDYSLAEVESRLLVERAIHDKPGLDERYRLAHLLLQPSVRREYAMVIIDTPPRMTLGTVNAFVASHSYVVPAILDRVSSEAVGPFLSQVEAMKMDLELDLRLAGLVGSMTRQHELTPTEEKYRDEIIATAKQLLKTTDDIWITRNLPRKIQVTNEDDIGYFLSDGQGRLSGRFYDPIFDELWNRIMSPQI